MVLTKSSDLLPEESIETNNYGNLFTQKSVVLDIPNNLFIKKLVKTHLGGLPLDNQMRKQTSYDLSNQKLVEGGFANLLERYLIEGIHVKIIFAQTNDISINLIAGVNF